MVEKKSNSNNKMNNNTNNSNGNKNNRTSGGKDRKFNRNPRQFVEPEVVWIPKTVLSKKVKDGTITEIEDIFNTGQKILESEIVDTLLPNLEEELLLVGQAKGKFGGGQKRIFRQTQKKTKEGNKIHFLTFSVVGNKNGYVGVAMGKSGETVPAREKSKRKARLNLLRVRRGCGSWQCNCKQPHTIPFTITGKCGSATIKLMPAPKGKGLCIESECGKILALAGIKDVWCKTSGQTKTKINLLHALISALKKSSEMKIKPEDIINLGIVDGKLKADDEPDQEELEFLQAEPSSETPVEEAGAEKTEEKVKEEVAEEVKAEEATEEATEEVVAAETESQSEPEQEVVEDKQ